MTNPFYRSLRFRLIVALIAVVTAALGTVILGALLYAAWVENRFFESLSEAAQEAYEEDWAIHGMPPEEVVQEISLAEEQILHPLYAAELDVVMILAAAVTGLSLPIAVWAARRLTLPLELASDSARVIAGGEFDHRPALPQGASSEVESLVRSFSELAESLERMEENVRFNAAAIAHEIRTPITAVQGYLQGIRDGVFEADEPLLDTMLLRMEALNRLLADLQTLSMAESGRLTLKKVPVDLPERLRRLVGWLDARSDGKVVFVAEKEARESTPEDLVEIDPERIEQVVIALVENARRHSGERLAEEPGSISVGYQRDEHEAAITVRDEGPGFSEAALENAHQRFWREETATGEERQGSGLGLAVARAVIEAHGGQIRLFNPSEGGGAVKLSWPA